MVFLKIIIRIQEGQIVTESELTCKELTELITDYLEARLSQADRVRFEQHMSICPGCVTYLDQMRATLKTLSEKPSLEIPKAMESDLLQAFRNWKDSR